MEIRTLAIAKYKAKCKEYNLKLIEKYKGSKTPIKFQCLKCETVKDIRPERLLGNPFICKVCLPNYRSITKFNNSREKYLKFFDSIGITLLEEYKGYKEDMLFKCNTCGHEWRTKPDYLKHNTHPCPSKQCFKPNMHNKVSEKDYDKKLFQKYGRKIKRVSDLEGMMEKCLHICYRHGEFIRTPQTLFRTPKGCQRCNILHRNDILRQKPYEVKQRLLKAHNGEVSLVSKLRGIDKKHTFKCSKGHLWDAILDSVLRVSGCPKCNNGAAYSKIGLEWINKWRDICPHLIIAADSIKGEKVLQGKSGQWWRVDGYCPMLKIVFEFDGDVFHGNPNLFKPNDKPHPFYKDITAKELKDKTVFKSLDLFDADYTVVRVWENDYIKGKMYSKIYGFKSVRCFFNKKA